MGPVLVMRGSIFMSFLLVIACLALSSASLESDQTIQQEQKNEASVLNYSTEDSDCRVSEQFPAPILKWCEWITKYADANQLSPDLVAAVMLMESGGDPLAYSRSGAVGLMQIMPRDGMAANFQCINGPCFANRPTIAELQEAEFNIQYGTHMLARLYSLHLNWRDALKAYGPMDVEYGYADKVLGIYERLRIKE
jgi:soluble lytic murein transglycosylase-like protein